MTVPARVPFLDLRAAVKLIEVEARRAIDEVIERADFIIGAATTRFEDAFARYVGTDHAVGVGNGLDALRLTLMALDVGPGDEVILPANTFIATALAVSGVGATPVLVDCDPQTYNLAPRQLAAVLTPRSKVVIPVHLTGRPAPMQEIMDMARERRLHVVEDVAQAAGATYRGRRCGSWATAGCFSFYPTKNLGAFGDGGLIATNDGDLAGRLRSLRHYGQRRRYEHGERGLNSRLDTIQAAVLNARLPHLDAANMARARHAARYRSLLEGVGDVACPAPETEGTHAYHLFVIETNQRDALQSYLAARGIETMIHYPRPIHLQEAYRGLGHSVGSFPEAERLAQRMLSLPLYPELPPEHLDHVANSIRSWFNSD